MKYPLIASSSGQTKSSAYAEHKGSSSCDIPSGDYLFRKLKEDQIMLKQQSERIQVLMEDNHRYLSSLATLKDELKEARNEFEFLSKYVKMLKSGTQSLENILNDGKSSSNKMGLGFSEGTFATISTTMFAKPLIILIMVSQSKKNSR